MILDDDVRAGPAVGDRFNLAEEGVHGQVTDVFRNSLGGLTAIVVEMDDGQFATVDMSRVERITVQ